MSVARHLVFSRSEWARLRENTPLTLGDADLRALRGLNDRLSTDDVVEIYLPLARLIGLRVAAARALQQATDAFLMQPPRQVPYVVGMAGSVAVGKSTTARVLQALLRHDHAQVDLVTTDGFLWPNATLEKRGLLRRKGFPESYDQRRLLRFLADVKSGAPEALAPVYSHQTYDVMPGQSVAVKSPDILILEGLNVLQGGDASRLFVSDYFDFSIYVDAAEADLQRWYVERFLALRETVFRDANSYFHRFAGLSREEAIAYAQGIWREINAVNLADNIAPTRERAHLILEKGPDHGVRHVRMRKR